MSGPLAAVLQQRVALSPSDFSAYLFGQRILSQGTLATDAEENKRVETTQLVITNFVVAKTGGVLSTGNIETDVGRIAVVRDNLDNEKAEFFGRLDDDKVELLGLLSFKKAWSSSWPLTPSLQDRSNMKRLVQIFGPQSQFHIFHIIAEMSTEHRGSKTIGATYLLKEGQDSLQGPWVQKVALQYLIYLCIEPVLQVPLHIPNLCQDLGLQYKVRP